MHYCVSRVGLGLRGNKTSVELSARSGFGDVLGIGAVSRGI